MAHLASPERFPSHVVVVDSIDGLLEVRTEGINLALWRREEDPDISDFFREVNLEKPIVQSYPLYMREAIMELDEHPGREKFLGMYPRLTEIMEQLQNSNRTYLASDSKDVEGHEFHQDRGYSLNWTMLGPACLWVPNGAAKLRLDRDGGSNTRWYNPPEDRSDIRQFPPGWIAVYQGMDRAEAEIMNGVGAFVHSRPPREKGTKRAHLQIYL